MQVYSIDWLAISCLCNKKLVYKIIDKPATVLNDLHRRNEELTFIFKRRDKGTTVFAAVLDIEINGISVAEFSFDPHEGIMKSEMSLLRIKNRFLYSFFTTDVDFYTPDEMIAIICKVLQVEPYKYSRLDVCCDFQSMIDRENPETLIAEFAAKKIRRIGRCKGAIFFRNDTKKGLEFNALKLGSPDSEVSIYMYNKSLEMKEEVNKPYIKRLWAHQEGYNKDRDVWRVEVSMKSKATSKIDAETGEFFGEYHSDTYRIGKAMFYYYFNKLFVFRIPHGCNVTRWKAVPTLDVSDIFFNDEFINEPSFTSSQRDKRLIKQLYLLTQEYSNGAFDYVKSPLNRIVQMLISQNDLQQWFSEKASTWTVKPKK